MDRRMRKKALRASRRREMGQPPRTVALVQVQSKRPISTEAPASVDASAPSNVHAIQGRDLDVQTIPLSIPAKEQKSKKEMFMNVAVESLLFPGCFSGYFVVIASRKMFC